MEPSQFPEEIQARLDAAGVTDEASLRVALDRDPMLREALLHDYLNRLLVAFLHVVNKDGLITFWQEVPEDLHESFQSFIQQGIAAAETAGNDALAAALQQRLDDLETLFGQTERPMLAPEFQQRLLAAGIFDEASLQEALGRDPQLAAEYDQAMQQLVNENPESMITTLLVIFNEVEQPEQLGDFWRKVPHALEDRLLDAVDASLAEPQQVADMNVVSRGRAHAALLREMKAQQDALRDAPPLTRAIVAFLRAETDAHAREIFQQQKAYLEPEDAQYEIDTAAREAILQTKEQITSRAALLRELRQEAGQQPSADAAIQGAASQDESLRSEVNPQLAADDPENIALHKQALVAAQQQGDPAEIAQAYSLLGNALLVAAVRTPVEQVERLYEALAAYEGALQFYTPEHALLSHAMIQGNLHNLYLSLAGIVGEDRDTRFAQALHAVVTALLIFQQEQQIDYIEQAQRQLRRIAAICGDDFVGLWAILNAGPPPEWLLVDDPAITEMLASFDPLLRSIAAVATGHTNFRDVVAQQVREREESGWMLMRPVERIWAGERVLAQLAVELDDHDMLLVRQILRLIDQPDMPAPSDSAITESILQQPAIPAELQQRLLAAGVTDESSLQLALAHDAQLAEQWQIYQLNQLLVAFLQAATVDSLITFWQQLPQPMEEPFLEHLQVIYARAEAQEDTELVAAIQQRRDILGLLPESE